MVATELVQLLPLVYPVHDGFLPVDKLLRAIQLDTQGRQYTESESWHASIATRVQFAWYMHTLGWLNEATKPANMMRCRQLPANVGFRCFLE